MGSKICNCSSPKKIPQINSQDIKTESSIYILLTSASAERNNTEEYKIIDSDPNLIYKCLHDH